jgi:hypothetical protein
MRRIGNVFIFDSESEYIREQSTPVITLELRDQDGNKINTLSALELTYYEKKTGDIINLRDKQNVLNTDGVVFSAGTVTWKLGLEDTKIMRKEIKDFDSDTKSEDWNEKHVALFKYKFNAGADQDWAQLEIYIMNLKTVL